MEEKKKKEKKVKVKVDLVSVQKDVLKEKEMGEVSGGSGGSTCLCDIKIGVPSGGFTGGG